MSLKSSALFLSYLLLNCVAKASPATVVKLSYGSFEGKSSGNLVEFFGIPFASPPIGDLRFAPPTPPKPFQGVRQATEFAPPCPQQTLNFTPPGAIILSNFSEDCLYLNVIKPANIKTGQKLPVVFYVYGGGFQIGDTSQVVGDALVNRSLTLDTPVIYVTAAYRLNGFGFLGGKEVKAARIGNTGIRDQRFALEWVQKHISAFGGDASKVTIWGISAGSISVGIHTLLDDGNPHGLFRGANSGGPVVLPNIISQQQYFDSLVADTNCTTSVDRLKCLRDAPFDTLMAAINNTPDLFSYQSIRLAWQPMVDGDLIVRDPQISVKSGKFAKIPLIAGCVEDEGTLMSLSTLNITTNAQFLEYMKFNFFNGISDADLEALEQAYPDDITQVRIALLSSSFSSWAPNPFSLKGSPFNTGTEYAVTPQYKRLAALQGDLLFHSPRRSFSRVAAFRQPVYGYLDKRSTNSSVGAVHGGDLVHWSGTSNTTDFIATDALIYFTHTGNPNAPPGSISLLGNSKWEPYGSSVGNPPLFTFENGWPAIGTTSDTFRNEAMELLAKLSWNEIGNRGV
ncbi:unnamed protein product [Cyclocybe aegerita]|uniref:Carboxylic ester hydrolase n=1 Tax=Cyclocybe aegerita TaxID=1973307 RepID=A0A8S0W9G5_CYCAE|nr:unnamed protein product [Cyclocybe aegerita]